MSTILIIILSLAAAVGLYVMTSYNSFVRLKNLVKEAWSGIDVQLKRRYDLIPNLVETVKGYATHEKSTFEEVVKLRNISSGAVSVKDKAEAETALSQGIGRLLAIAEAYPQLKADANFQSLQTSLSGIEDEIQMARRYYNGTAREFNTGIQMFPGNFIAGAFGFNAPVEYFEVESEAEKKAPQVKF